MKELYTYLTENITADKGIDDSVKNTLLAFVNFILAKPLTANESQLLNSVPLDVIEPLTGSLFLMFRSYVVSVQNEVIESKNTEIMDRFVYQLKQLDEIQQKAKEVGAEKLETVDLLSQLSQATPVV